MEVMHFLSPASIWAFTQDTRTQGCWKDVVLFFGTKNRNVDMSSADQAAEKKASTDSQQPNGNSSHILFG